MSFAHAVTRGHKKRVELKKSKMCIELLESAIETVIEQKDFISISDLQTPSLLFAFPWVKNVSENCLLQQIDCKQIVYSQIAELVFKSESFQTEHNPQFLQLNFMIKNKK